MRSIRTIPRDKTGQALPMFTVGLATIAVASFDYGTNRTTRIRGQSGGGRLQPLNIRSDFNATTPGLLGPGFFGSGYAQVVS